MKTRRKRSRLLVEIGKLIRDKRIKVDVSGMKNKTLEQLLLKYRPFCELCPSGRSKLKVNPAFNARCRAHLASHDLRVFAGVIYRAALANDKLFFDYLAKYQRSKPTWSPISEEQSKLLTLYFQNPRLSASEALEKLRSPGSKGYYRGTKKKTLERAAHIAQVWHNELVQMIACNKGVTKNLR